MRSIDVEFNHRRSAFADSTVLGEQLLAAGCLSVTRAREESKRRRGTTVDGAQRGRGQLIGPTATAAGSRLVWGRGVGAGSLRLRRNPRRGGRALMVRAALRLIVS